MPTFHCCTTLLQVMKNVFCLSTKNEKESGYCKLRNQTSSTEILAFCLVLYERCCPLQANETWNEHYCKHFFVQKYVISTLVWIQAYPIVLNGYSPLQESSTTQWHNFFNPAGCLLNRKAWWRNQINCQWPKYMNDSSCLHATSSVLVD